MPLFQFQSGQFFQFGNLDNSLEVRTDMGGASAGGANFHKSFFDIMAHDLELMNALWRPDPASGLTTRVNVKPLSEYPESSRLPRPSPANMTTSTFGFGKLANELISIVFENLDHPSDVASLLMTCQRNFDIGRSHFARLLHEIFTPSWAGDRLICLWTNLDINDGRDLPRGMLTKEEMRLLEQNHIFSRCVNIYQGIDGNSDDEVGKYPDPYRIVKTVQSYHPDAARRTKLIKNSVGFYLHIRKTMEQYFFSTLCSLKKHDGCSRCLNHTQTSLLFNLVHIVGLDTNDLYADRDEDIMVLRNLTTKEYIRGNAVYRFSLSQPWLKFVRFEHALVLRILWSSASLSCSYEGPLQLHRGPWAGHRFDISKVCNKDDVAGWKDVSDEVLGEVEAVFRQNAEYAMGLIEKREWQDGLQ